jgi:serine/threonine protein kinase
VGELIGAMAGGFRIVARLGAGGMGEVYEGVHPTIGKSVAIKVLHTTGAGDPAAHQRFFLEAQAVVRVNHDGVVSVFDVGSLEDGRPYLVMELLEGQSLHALNKQARLPVKDACRIVMDVLDALAAVHAVGVVHRDLKPSNIFRTRSGRTVVVDFGIAKLLAPDAPHPLTTAGTAVGTPHLLGPGSPHSLTMAGTAIGTPHYMAPEQIRGLPVTPAIDIYAAGVTLFELLCGRRPFEGADEDIYLGHLERRPPPPRALEPSIPLPVQDVILTALAMDPAKRHASAAVMRELLRAAIEDSAAAATPPAAEAHSPSARREPVPSPPTAEPTLHDTPAAETAAGPTVRDSPAARAPRASQPPPRTPEPARWAPDVTATVAPPDTHARELTSSAPNVPARSHRARWVVAGAAVVAAGVGAIVDRDRSSFSTAQPTIPMAGSAITRAPTAAPDGPILDTDVGDVEIRVSPASGGISVDSKLVGTGRWNGALRVGLHRIEVSAESYIPQSSTIDVGPAKRSVLSFVLEKNDDRKRQATELW